MKAQLKSLKSILQDMKDEIARTAEDIVDGKYSVEGFRIDSLYTHD